MKFSIIFRILGSLQAAGQASEIESEISSLKKCIINSLQKFINHFSNNWNYVVQFILGFNDFSNIFHCIVKTNIFLHFSLRIMFCTFNEINGAVYFKNVFKCSDSFEKIGSRYFFVLKNRIFKHRSFYVLCIFICGIININRKIFYSKVFGKKVPSEFSSDFSL